MHALLEAADADVVQTHLLYANVVGTLAARDAGLPSIATLHQSPRGLRRFESARELVESVTLRRHTTRVIAVGWVVADANRRRLGRIPIDVVPNPVPVPEPVAVEVRDALRTELLGDLPGPIVLAVGRLEEVKGFGELVTAMSAVVERQPGAVLAIAGDGSLRGELAVHARRHGIERNVRLLGERSDVGALLSIAEPLRDVVSVRRAAVRVARSHRGRCTGRRERESVTFPACSVRQGCWSRPAIRSDSPRP